MSKLDKIYAEAEFKPYVDRIKELEAKVEAANKIFTKSLKTIIEQKMLETVSDNAVFSLHFSKADIIALKNALQFPRSDEQKLTCDKTREPPCHLEPSPELCAKCELNNCENKEKK